MRLRISYNLKHLNCTSPFLSLKGFYKLDTLCRMPTLPHRQAALKGIDRELAHSASAPRTKSIRRLVYFHLCLRREIVLRRYWARPKTYKHARYACHIDAVLSAPPREFKFLFRMSHPEYLRLVLRFGQDVVFHACCKRQPADPKYQLALFIYRLAHGTSVSTRGSRRRHTHDVCFRRSGEHHQ
jgi:hypothetical protein